jgi:hypothetical protein
VSPLRWQCALLDSSNSLPELDKNTSLPEAIQPTY